MKYGATMIAESRLEAVPNDTPDRDDEIDFALPEFTCLAPDSGFPDFATIRIRNIPDQKLVELESLKLYINNSATSRASTQKGYVPNGANRAQP